MIDFVRSGEWAWRGHRPRPTVATGEFNKDRSSIRRIVSRLRCILEARAVIGDGSCQQANAVLLRASGAQPAFCDRSLAAVCLLFGRRVLLRELPPGASPGIVLAPGGQPRHRVCRSQRSTLALYGEALLVREARQNHRNRVTIDAKREIAGSRLLFGVSVALRRL